MYIDSVGGPWSGRKRLIIRPAYHLLLDQNVVGRKRNARAQRNPSRSQRLRESAQSDPTRFVVYRTAARNETFVGGAGITAAPTYGSGRKLLLVGIEGRRHSVGYNRKIHNPQSITDVTVGGVVSKSLSLWPTQSPSSNGITTKKGKLDMGCSQTSQLPSTHVSTDCTVSPRESSCGWCRVIQ